MILVDGDQAAVHLRPEDHGRASAFRDKMAMKAEAQKRYVSGCATSRR